MHKVAPVCHDLGLAREATSTEALHQQCFAPHQKPTAVVPRRQPALHDAIPVSSSSSTCTRDSDWSDAEGHVKASTPRCLDREVGERLNEKVSMQKVSRQGRLTQRWLMDPETAETVRLVTGCVPILKGGKILFVSSSRKAEWILPKGGWEQDETMEESAVRECFEEAGVLGTLGPRLKDVQYEPRKAKKRRLEQASMLEKKLKQESEDEVERRRSMGSESASPDPAGVSTPTTTNTMPSPISREDMFRIRGQAQAANKASDETLSVGSTLSSTYSQVRMTLFPLYVSEVHSTWPESGRFRKAVDIDTAIAMMESRPEFKVALQEVKDRGLHLVTQP